jgi:uncharacterized LabA/DUF88 family protein
LVAHAHIDGFALYHMCFRGARNDGNRSLKWLDLVALARALLPDEEVDVVRYYTARVGDVPEDPSRAARQDAYLRALATLPELSIHQGIFHTNKREVRLVRCPPGIDPVQTARVRQEKGSDVALATHLLLDAIDERFEAALVVTNDSDFVEPINIVRTRFRRRVIVISPDTVVAKTLARAASYARPLDHRLLAACQLAEVVADREGRAIRRPDAWT